MEQLLQVGAHLALAATPWQATPRFNSGAGGVTPAGGAGSGVERAAGGSGQSRSEQGAGEAGDSESPSPRPSGGLPGTTPGMKWASNILAARRGFEAFMLDEANSGPMERVRFLNPDFICFHMLWGAPMDGKPYPFHSRLLAQDAGLTDLACPEQGGRVLARWREAFPNIPFYAYCGTLEGYWDFWDLAPDDFANTVLECVRPFLDIENCGYVIDASNWAPSLGSLTARVRAVLEPYNTAPYFGHEAWPMKGRYSGEIEAYRGRPRAWFEDPKTSHWMNSWQIEQVRQQYEEQGSVLCRPEENTGPIFLIEEGIGFPDADRWGGTNGRGRVLAYDRAISLLRDKFSISIEPIWPDNPRRMTAAQIKAAAEI